jgi:translation elongation factor EF-Tu-like GTPase
MPDDSVAVSSWSWFTVAKVFTINGRGTVVAGTFELSVNPAAGDRAEDADARHWDIAGVERFVAFLGKPTRAGEPVGLLLKNAAPGHFRGGDRLLFKGERR